ncbi:MAG: response regulator, partial [bacterium]
LVSTGQNSAKDVGLMRRLLRREWSSSPVRQNMLETFLQVLMDEQFIDKLDRAAGKILIVDPTEGSTSIMAAPLMKYGYDIQTAATSEVASTLLATFNPDLILCDRDLPGGDGIAFCEKVKGRPETSHMKVIVLSARKGGKEYAAESLRAGADDFLPKPVDLEVLFLKIRQIMSATRGYEEKDGIRGLLREMSFVDMIQILSAGGKSKEIVLTNGDKEGCVYIDGGEVVHAAVGNVVGVEAFAQLMHWTDGEFVMKQCASFPDRTINSPAMFLLMQGAKAIDEKTAMEVSPQPPPSVA